jgi:hypothetical protein
MERQTDKQRGDHISLFIFLLKKEGSLKVRTVRDISHNRTLQNTSATLQAQFRFVAVNDNQEYSLGSLCVNLAKFVCFLKTVSSINRPPHFASQITTVQDQLSHFHEALRLPRGPGTRSCSES